ncbi:MAG: hypothetical protein FRX49_08405 [Trebouxia sp. A1-2]|nr:MAG: hypothetical protein FRX49_08405 [Trebouxia sp. A1-2]
MTVTVSLLLRGSQATFVQPRVVPAALKVYSDAAAPRCGVSYLVLRAAMDASCEQQCQLTLAEQHTPSTGPHNTGDAIGRSAGPESQLLSSNVTSLHDQEAPVDHEQQKAVSAGCIHELNMTVIKSSPLKPTEDDVFETTGSNWLNSWLTKATLMCSPDAVDSSKGRQCKQKRISGRRQQAYYTDPQPLKGKEIAMAFLCAKLASIAAPKVPDDKTDALPQNH